MDRTAYLANLIGRPWSADQSCWHLARDVQREVFGRDLPMVAVPPDASWRWMIDTISGHPEHQQWREVAYAPGQTITAPDGALVLMARVTQSAHIGVWLASEAAILHADPVAGVALEPVVKLRARGWSRLRFYEPV